MYLKKENEDVFIKQNGQILAVVVDIQYIYDSLSHVIIRDADGYQYVYRHGLYQAVYDLVAENLDFFFQEEDEEEEDKYRF